MLLFSAFMNDPVVGEMMLARLELLHPEISAFLIAAPTSQIACRPLCENLADAAGRLGRSVRLVDLTTSHDPTGRTEIGLRNDKESIERRYPTGMLNAEMLHDQVAARALIQDFDGLSVVVGRGVLDDPATLMAIRVVDAVVMIARVGKTLRTDLEKTRLQVEQVGGSIAGAIELH